MAKAQTFREVSLDSGNGGGGSWSGDYPRGCDVAVSMDGSSWGTAIATATGSSQVVVIDFATVTARYVRVTLNSAGASTTHWWSLAEFNVLY